MILTLPAPRAGAPRPRGRLRRACLALAGLLPALAALAAPAATGGATPEALYRQECGACHMAYPPRLLPSASWAALVGDLPHHFGTDASVDAGTRDRLARWLAAQASSTRPRPAGDRITRSGWFAHEHDEVPAATWSRASIQSASHCDACHAGAESGDFDEHTVRIPR